MIYFIAVLRMTNSDGRKSCYFLRFPFYQIVPKFWRFYQLPLPQALFLKRVLLKFKKFRINFKEYVGSGLNIWTRKNCKWIPQCLRLPSFFILPQNRHDAYDLLLYIVRSEIRNDFFVETNDLVTGYSKFHGRIESTKTKCEIKVSKAGVDFVFR